MGDNELYAHWPAFTPGRSIPDYASLDSILSTMATAPHFGHLTLIFPEKLYPHDSHMAPSYTMTYTKIRRVTASPENHITINKRLAFEGSGHYATFVGQDVRRQARRSNGKCQLVCVGASNCRAFHGVLGGSPHLPSSRRPNAENVMTPLLGVNRMTMEKG